MAHERYEACIEACEICAAECESCGVACLNEEEVKMMVRCIRLTRSCADMCKLAGQEMSRSSHFAEKICQLCAEICEACADECARHDVDHCQRCAQACRDCAEECRVTAGIEAE